MTAFVVRLRNIAFVLRRLHMPVGKFALAGERRPKMWCQRLLDALEAALQGIAAGIITSFGRDLTVTRRLTGARTTAGHHGKTPVCLCQGLRLRRVLAIR